MSKINLTENMVANTSIFKDGYKMNRSKICKFSIALAVCCALACGVAIAPLIASVAFAVVAFICLLCCVIILFVGIFVWLFTAGQTSIFPYASKLADFATGLFSFVSPVARFSFDYITPIAGGIALGLGALGLIVSSVGISRAKNSLPSDEIQDEPVYPEETDGKKKKVKKKKTEKGECIASLAVSIVFSVVALIAIIIAVIGKNMI